MIRNEEELVHLAFVIKSAIDLMDEKKKRYYLGIVAKYFGYGGVSMVSDLTGVARSTIISGTKETLADENPENQKDDSRIRKPGGGRKTAAEKNPKLLEFIEAIVSKDTYGTPMHVLRWKTMSLRDIADTLKDTYNIEVSHNVVGRALDDLDYSRHQNQKSLQTGEPSPDRNAQFEYIDNKASQFIEEGEPVISVDTKKKELVGNFKNNGSEYRKKGDFRQVLDHEFEIPELGKVAPYGVYVLNDNTGFVNLGTSGHDTSDFAVESIFRWWMCVGKHTYPNATKLYITADSGGSNGVRVRAWKYELQNLANKTGLEIHVSHYPSGTSKWNKIEHRLFCFISKTWQGQPLVDIETIVKLISSTTTKKGLKVQCVVDDTPYELKRKISDEEFNSINFESCDQFGMWNYIIRPNKS